MDVNCHVYFLSVIIVGIICDYHTKAEQLHLCQHESKEIQCSSGQRIEIETMKQTTLTSNKCQVIEKENCKSNFTLMKDKCNGHQTCKLNGSDFSSSVCKVYPRYLKVVYKCTSKDPRWGDIFAHRDVCYFPSEVSCGISFWISYIALSFRPEILSRCDKSKNDIDTCLSQDLSGMCIGNRLCYRQNAQQNWCFTFPYAIYVSYRCSEGFCPEKRITEERTSVVNLSSAYKASVAYRYKNVIIYNVAATQMSHEHLLEIIPYVNPLVDGINTEILFGGDQNNSCPYDNVNSTGNIKDQTPKVKINSENESTITKGSGFPVLPGLGGTPEFPSVSGVSPPIDLSDTPIPEVNYGIILASCGGVLLLAVILISTFCLLRYKRKLKKTEDLGNGDKRLRLSTTETRNNEHFHAELATQDGEYSEISPLQNASNSTTQNQHNAYFILEPNARYFKTEISSNEDNNAVPDSGYSEVYQEDDQYAVSSEGVYDITNSRRHKESDNMYSHTTEGVYDISYYNRTDLSDGNDTYS